MATTCERLSPREQYAICATGALAHGTLRKYLLWLAAPPADRGVPCRPVVIYRLKSALQQLGLTDRFPELFEAAQGGALDPNPHAVIEPEDAEADAAARAAE